MDRRRNLFMRINYFHSKRTVLLSLAPLLTASRKIHGLQSWPSSGLAKHGPLHSPGVSGSRPQRCGPPPAAERRCWFAELAMAVEDGKAARAKAEGKAWGFCRFPFFGSGSGSGGGSASSSTTNSSTALSLTHRRHPRSSGRSQVGQREGAASRRSSGAGSVSSVARSLLPTRRRLRLDPSAKLYFPCECLLWSLFFGFLFSIFDSSSSWISNEA